MIHARYLLAAPLAIAAALVEVYAAAPEETIEVALEELQAIDWRPGAELPAWVKALDKKRVKISGYMNVGTPEGVEEFQLVTDSCGCSGKARPHHFVLVKLDGETTTYKPDKLVVSGTLEIGEVVEDGFVTSLFRLTAESVE